MIQETVAGVETSLQRIEASHRRKGSERQKLDTTLPDLSYNSPLWDSAKSRRTSGGYIARYFYHPGLQKLFSKQEHILIWERIHQREVPRGWCIHHRNGDRSNNRAENLIAMPIVFHQELHAALRKIEKKLTGVPLEVARHRIVEEYSGKAEYYSEIWQAVDTVLREKGLY